MLYYIAERVFTDKFEYSFLFHLIKRCDSKEEAIQFCKDAVNKWREEEGLDVRLNYNVDIRKFPELIDTAEVVGAMALDYNYVCKHMYEIFATPSFMAGGFEGL